MNTIATADSASSDMQLRVTRTQSSGFTGKITYKITGRLYVSEKDAELVKKYGLGSLVVYDSEARKKHNEAVMMGAQSAGLGSLARALGSAALASLSLRITVDALLRGTSVDGKDLNQVIEAQGAFLEASKAVKSYIQVAETFDGREEVFAI